MVNFYYVMFIVGLFFIAILIILWGRLSKKSKKTYTTNIRICPKCKSKNIKADFSAHSFAQGSVFNKYKCNNCGFAGIFFPEIDKKSK